ncbi:hypothetical protein PHJA_000411900 [Phtheirospermum japonicum]|uniref:Uncharacterized protein n=1 Tax=Phtheirospermum japonicum TaxID=374723 RepID=A0A830BC76_9LAMI|nr:hypothetical protein PHJA_000411900 [Phtheirospermum japonicum]
MSLRQRSSISLSNQPSTSPNPPPPSQPAQSVLSQALQSSAHLANLLPTGTLLTFQLLTPIFTNNGSCDSATRPLTLILLAMLAVSCFLASFTDSIKASDGQVYYGFATRKGLWLFDNNVPPRDLSKYRLSFIDFVHAVMSVLVFVAVALRDKNVVGCLYPEPGTEAREVLDILPVGVGFVSGSLFIMFPTRRHGIGYPVTRDP